MVTSIRRLGFLSGISLMMLGCSALGLDDDLRVQAMCGVEMSTCSDLDVIEPQGACLAWRCSDRVDPAAGVCIVDLLDRDGDGSPAPECATPDRAGDCDDDAPTNGPNLVESCDRRDNDCDMRIDEGVMRVSVADLPTAAGVLRLISYGQTQVNMAMAYRSGARLAVTLSGESDAGSTQTLRGAAENSNPVATAITSLGDDWAIAFTQGSGCSRLQLGVWNGADPNFHVDSAFLDSGMPKPTGSCPDDASPVGIPVVASLSRQQALVAVVGDEGRDSCSPVNGPVNLVVAQRPFGASGPFDSMQAVDSGLRGIQARIGLAAISADFGYLLAVVEADGIGLHRVTVDGGSLLPTLTRLERIPCVEGCAEVSLVGLSPTRAALSYRDGSCERALARGREIEVLDGSIRLGLDLSTIAIDGVRNPVLTLSSAPEEWTLAWSVTRGDESERGVRAQRYSPAGEPQGPPSIISMVSTGESIAIQGGVGARSSTVYFYETGSGLSRASLACGE